MEHFKSDESSIEIELREICDSMNLFLKIADIRQLGEIFPKVVDKIKELRESRDSWRNKYYALIKSTEVKNGRT